MRGFSVRWRPPKTVDSRDSIGANKGANAPAARRYKDNARAILDALNLDPIPGRVAVALVAHPPDRRRRDLDNLVKIVLDSLKGAAFGDDHLIDRISIERGDVKPGGLIQVRIAPM